MRNYGIVVEEIATRVNINDFKLKEGWKEKYSVSFKSMVTYNDISGFPRLYENPSLKP